MSKRTPSVELSRREFFPLAAGAAAVAAGSGLAADTPKLPRLKKAVKYDMVAGKGTAKEKFALLKKLGFQGVEINSPSGLEPGRTGRRPRRDRHRDPRSDRLGPLEQAAVRPEGIGSGRGARGAARPPSRTPRTSGPTPSCSFPAW